MTTSRLARILLRWADRYPALRVWTPAPVVRRKPFITENPDMTNLAPIVLVDPDELEMWPHVPDSSSLWSLEFARDTQRIMTAIEKADSPREIQDYDAIMNWLFDICIAWDALCRFTDALGPFNVALMYYGILNEMQYRQSPLLNSPENLDENPKIAFVRLKRRFRDVSERFPRLLKLMEYVAVLSPGEARSGLAAYLRGERWAGEAIDHFGGTRAVVERAVQNRVRISGYAMIRCRSKEACRWHGTRPQTVEPAPESGVLAH